MPEGPKFTQKLSYPTLEQEVSDPRLDPTWEQRVSKAIRQWPDIFCPDCGSKQVRFEFRFEPSAEQRQAIEPYKEFIYFGYRTCCPSGLNTPRVLEAWTCRQCGENWDEVFYQEQRPAPKAGQAEATVKSIPRPTEAVYPASVVCMLVEQAHSLLERNAQLEHEKRSGFSYQINESLHNPHDGVAWFMVLFVISIALTLTFLPGGAALFVSVIIAVVPATLVSNKKH
jgi:ribosomal protein L37AE/L43A